MLRFSACLLLAITFFTKTLYCQDSLHFNYTGIYALCLDADVKSALILLETDSTKKISSADAKFKADFEKRFKYDADESNYLEVHASGINTLLRLFHSYWRQSLLRPETNLDTMLIASLKFFLNNHFLPVKSKLFNVDSIDMYLKKYIESKGLHTSGFGKTGKLFDLLVWKTERDTVYSFTIHREKISSKVFMLNDFITLGWEEYATLQRYYPGGWATTEALYCVQQAYDLHSEGFLISYLAHESRHFADYILFPKLTSADLEYRAKLTELCMARKTLYKLIGFFINNANYESKSGHSVANYRVIRDLSQCIFGVAFEKEPDRWKTVSPTKINRSANKLLRNHTKSLQK